MVIILEDKEWPLLDHLHKIFHDIRQQLPPAGS